MNAFEQFRKSFLCTIAAALCLAGLGNSTPLMAQSQDQDEEVQMGQEVFNELKAKGEIIESSPLYDQLKPIADAITRAAQPRYNHPFKFYLCQGRSKREPVWRSKSRPVEGYGS